MSLLSRAVLIVLLSALTGPLIAAEPPAEVTWSDCVKLAAQHNPALAAARAQIEAARADTDVARAALRPQLSAGASAKYTERSGRVSSSDTSYGADVQVEQSLYSGGRNTANVRSARASQDRTEATAAGNCAQLTYELRSAFVSLLYAQEQVDVLRDIEKRRRDNTELVNLRYDGGREHKGSLAMSKATLNEASADLRQAERQVIIARRTLLEAMGMSGAPAMVKAKGLLATGDVPEAQEWTRSAQRTPEYAAALASVESARAQWAVARSGYLPEASASAGAGRSGNQDEFRDDQWSVGLRVSFPFWSGGRNVAQVRRAEASLREAEANLADTRDHRARDLAETWLAFTNAVDAVAVQRTYLEAAGIRAEIARQQYGDGLLSFDNWDLIESDVIGRRKSLLDRQRGGMLAEAAWNRVTGGAAFNATPAESGGR